MLCARRTESLWLRLVVLTLVVLLVIASWVAGSEPWRKPLSLPESGWAERFGCVDVAGRIDLGTYRAQFRRVLHWG